MRLRRSFALSSSVLFTVSSLPVPFHIARAEVLDKISSLPSERSDSNHIEKISVALIGTKTLSRGTVVDYSALLERRRLSEVHYALYKGVIRPVHQPRHALSKNAEIGQGRSVSITPGFRRNVTSVQTPTTQTAIGITISSIALGLVGRPYVWGGQTLDGFDCSGFTQYVFRKAGIVIPRTSFAQFATGVSIGVQDLQPGDLLFYQTYAEGASHVAIYVGNGLMVQAENEKSGVVATSVYGEYYREHFIGAKRLWY